ncbi:hypothetical protein [Frigoribacterium sp. R86507]|uniref:hypothetical protein n=1 Tax=Frigoribacterium sp. R86507 TaxID=3093850 RepID=UPI0037C5C70D
MAVSRTRRLAVTLVVATTVGLLAGCTPAAEPNPSTSSRPDGSEPAVTHNGPQPTAMSTEDGVEVWDLTVPPSAEAFGIDTSDGSSSRVRPGAYSSSGGGGRPVRFLLPGGKTVDVRANEVIFQLNDSPEGVTDPTSGEVLVPAGRKFSLRVDAPAAEGAEAGVAAYQEALAAVGLPADTVDELRQKIDGGPTGRPGDAPQSMGVSADLPRQQGVGFGVSTTFQPDSDDLVFLLEYDADWDVVPIP